MPASPGRLPSPHLQVRHELEQGHSVRYLLPEPAARYIYQHGLYNTGGPQRPRLLHPYGEHQVDSERD